MEKLYFNKGLLALILGTIVLSSGCKYIPDDFFHSVNSIQKSPSHRLYEPSSIEYTENNKP